MGLVRRKFTREIKLAAVEELIRGSSSTAQICRKYEIADGQLYYWKKLYEQGKLGLEATKEWQLEQKVAELERMVGRLAMENDLLKKARAKFLEQAMRKESSLPLTLPKGSQSERSADL